VIAIGVAVLFAGYTVGIWGYCLTQSYDVTFPQLFKSTWPGAAAPQITGSATLQPPTDGRRLGTITGNEQIITGG
jgi:hypothetical protein